ncbi:hypothetical protein A2U01_0053311 [Trifolium medium]|uniref:Uncharacterized protein n=1 Tax=Trifolium medium TaxID=97028 RepID=A0A392R780_9FABA|nr:hypothetical protein [Trifolium medium]
MQKSAQLPVLARRTICSARRAVVSCTEKFEFLNRRAAPYPTARRATSRRFPSTTCFTWRAAPYQAARRAGTRRHYYYP